MSNTECITIYQYILRIYTIYTLICSKIYWYLVFKYMSPPRLLTKVTVHNCFSKPRTCPWKFPTCTGPWKKHPRIWPAGILSSRLPLEMRTSDQSVAQLPWTSRILTCNMQHATLWHQCYSTQIQTEFVQRFRAEFYVSARKHSNGLIDILCVNVVVTH